MESLNISMQLFFEWLLRATIQASLLICLILLLQLMLRGKLGARGCHALWLLLLIRMVMPWAPQSRVSIFNLIPQRQIETESVRQEVADSSFKSNVPGRDTNEPTVVSTTEVPENTAEAITATAEPGTETTSPLKLAFFEAADILPFLWLAGALALAVYICANNFALLRIVRRERPLTDQKILDLLEDCKAQMDIRIVLGIVATDKVKSPALFGFVRPRLLLPAGMIETLSREELRYVFLHELGHLKRHDIYLGWLMSLLQVMHWFNPLIWLAFYRMRADREFACDALVLARTQMDESKDYGRTVVSLLERFSRPQPLPSMAGILETKAQLKRRITMIAQFKKTSYQWSPLAVILIIILGCISLPDARRTKASGMSAAKPAPAMVVRRVWARWPDPKFRGAPSPDGKYLSFVDLRTGDLAVRELASGKNRRLTNEGWEKGFAMNSVFSPDGKQVAYYWWDNKEGNQLRIIGVDGSGARVVANHLVKPDDTVHEPPSGWIYSPAGWSADGEHILAWAVDNRLTKKQTRIVLVAVDGGSVRSLKTLHGNISEISLSPDGRFVAYSFPVGDDSPNRDISIVATDGSGETVLVEHPADDGFVDWAPDGKRVVFASDRTGSMGIWAIEVADGKPRGAPQLLRPEIGRFHPMGFSQDGSYYYGVFSGGSNVYVAPYDPQKGNVTGKPVLTIKRYEGSNEASDWSPDGRHLACVSGGNRFLGNRFLIRSLETGEVREVSPSEKVSGAKSMSWTPDGRSLLFYATSHRGILKIDVETGNVTTVVQRSISPNLAADAKTIFYVVRGNGWRILRHDLSTADKEELYRATVGQHGVGAIVGLVLSPDGKQLAFQDLDAGMLKVLSVTGGQPRELVKFKGKATIAWAPDGSHLLYANWLTTIRPGGLWRISAGGGEPQKLDLEMRYVNHVRFHPDGRQITFTARAQGRIEVWVMENFLPASK